MRRSEELEPLVRLLSATVVIGAVSGAVIGGLGGRVAMRILFLTSGPVVKGLESDDGFQIGRFTLANTVGLVIITTFIGVVAALLYLVARPFAARLGGFAVPAMALFYGVIGGAMMVHTGGVDFVVLRPPLLAVVLFVSICGGFGAVVARLVNAASRADAWPQSRSRWLLGPPLLLLVFPPFLVVAIGALAVNWEDRAAGHSPVIWNALNAGAATVMSGLFVLGAVDLARDIAGLT